MLLFFCERSSYFLRRALELCYARKLDEVHLSVRSSHHSARRPLLLCALPGATSAVLASCPGGACCPRFFCKIIFLISIVLVCVGTYQSERIHVRKASVGSAGATTVALLPCCAFQIDPSISVRRCLAFFFTVFFFTCAIVFRMFFLFLCHVFNWLQNRVGNVVFRPLLSCNRVCNVPISIVLVVCYE